MIEESCYGQATQSTARKLRVVGMYIGGTGAGDGGGDYLADFFSLAARFSGISLVIHDRLV